MVACHALQSVSTRIMWVAVQRTTISALGVRNAKSPPQQDSVTAALGSHLHKQSLRATCLWQTRRVRCGLFRQSHGPDVRNMSPLPRSSFIINLPILVLFPLLAHSRLVPAKQSSTSTLILLATLAPPLERRSLATQQPQRHVSLRPIRLSRSMLMGSTRLSRVSTVIFGCTRCRATVRNRPLPRARSVEANCAEKRPILILSRHSCGIFRLFMLRN